MIAEPHASWQAKHVSAAAVDRVAAAAPDAPRQWREVEEGDVVGVEQVGGCYTAVMAARKSLMILIAGPYRSGTGDDPGKLAANVAAMEALALPIFRAGHVPVVGEWLALPLCQLAGSTRVGDAAFQEVFHPIAERLLEHCDGVLRTGGASQGADLMVATAERLGLAVYRRLEDVPGCAG